MRDVRGEIAEADKPREIGQAHTLGSRRSSPGISLATSCRPIARHYPRSATMSLFSGIGSCAGAARGHTWHGRRWRNSPTTFSQGLVSSIPGRACGLPSSTRGRSRVREFRPHGSVRGALSNERPYREHLKHEWAERQCFVCLFCCPSRALSLRMFDVGAHLLHPCWRPNGRGDC